MSNAIGAGRLARDEGTGKDPGHGQTMAAPDPPGGEPPPPPCPTVLSLALSGRSW